MDIFFNSIAILYNDLVPVFVDSNPETLGLDINDLEQKLIRIVLL